MSPACCLPAVLLAALARLRRELRAAGCDLVVRVGPAPTTTAAIAGAAGVKRIVIERQEESRSDGAVVLVAKHYMWHGMCVALLSACV
jgi:deoxyribodipyrimidine photolyase